MTITIDRAVVEQALEALEQSNRFVWHYAMSKYTIRKAQACDDAITALKAALAQEPGFWGRVAARQASRIKQIEAAAQQALEALALAQLNGEAGLRDYEVLEIAESAVALEAALAQQQAEPPGCDRCNHPLYAATRCRVCGRVTA